MPAPARSAAVSLSALTTGNGQLTTDPAAAAADEPPLRVMALHALLYCERLFYLEEVEEIRVADAAVYAGRRLHDEVLPLDDESPERRSVEVASEAWGVFGKVNAIRRRDGAWVAYEHKRGRCRRGDDNTPLFEQRLEESHQHPHTGQSMTYARLVELEVRLLEKEWTGCPGLFARMRLR